MSFNAINNQLSLIRDRGRISNEPTGHLVRTIDGKGYIFSEDRRDCGSTPSESQMKKHNERVSLVYSRWKSRGVNAFNSRLKILQEGTQEQFIKDAMNLGIHRSKERNRYKSKLRKAINFRKENPSSSDTYQNISNKKHCQRGDSSRSSIHSNLPHSESSQESNQPRMICFTKIPPPPPSGFQNPKFTLKYDQVNYFYISNHNQLSLASNPRNISHQKTEQELLDCPQAKSTSSLKLQEKTISHLDSEKVRKPKQPRIRTSSPAETHSVKKEFQVFLRKPSI